MLRFLETNSTIINHKSLIINVSKMRGLIDYRHFVQLKWCNSILRFFQTLHNNYFLPNPFSQDSKFLLLIQVPISGLGFKVSDAFAIASCLCFEAVRA